MVVKINGKSEDVQGATVLDLLKAKNIDPHMVAVELNATMLERDQLGAAAVKEGDSLEFLFYMGGGAPCPGKRASVGKSRSWSARGWVGEVTPRGGWVNQAKSASRRARGGRVTGERGRLDALGVGG